MILCDHLLFIETQIIRISSNETADENAARKLRKILCFQRLEKSNAYLGGVRDFLERDAAHFALAPQIFTKPCHLNALGPSTGPTFSRDLRILPRQL